MADYSYQDLMKMQNDAIRRAEDMQRRARQSAGLERERGENQPNITAKKEEPRRVPMPNDYLENLKKYGSTSSNKKDSEQSPKEESGREYKTMIIRGKISPDFVIFRLKTRVYLYGRS